MQAVKNDMRGHRANSGASLKLSYSMAMPEHIRGRIREITCMYSVLDQRGMGHASRLLDEVGREADLSNYILMLMPKPYGDKAMNESDLIAWYARHGFRLIQNNPFMMARPHG